MEFYRSWLFAPGNRPDRCLKALASGADQTIWDLEDAVPTERKEEARSQVGALLNTSDERTPWVRINPVTADLGLRDIVQLAPVVRAGAGRWMIPKTDGRSARTLQSLRNERRLDGELLLLIENAAGLCDLMDPGLRELWLSIAPARLAFGGLDFVADLGGRADGEDIYLFPRSQLALVSRMLGWPPPIDTIYPKIDDITGLEESTRKALRLGFAGKLLIHPRQVEPVHNVFRPTTAEVAWAREVMRATAESSQGAVRVEGAMVDLPVLKMARRILDIHEGDGDPRPS